MKKVFGILAVAVLTLGLFSCEAETNVQETESLFETIEATSSAVDGDNGESDPRSS